MTNDADERMRLNNAPSPWATAIEFGGAVSSRVALGFQVGFPPTVSGSTSGSSFRSSGKQTERTLIGFALVRLAATQRAAIEVMAGAGVLFQRHEQSQAPCPSCADTYFDTMTRNAPAFILGADVPYRVAPHVWLSWFGRWYVLKREPHKAEDSRNPLPWQYEWGPSTRASLGVSARVGW
jgi:hypothetical protein